MKNREEAVGPWSFANPQKNSYVCELCDPNGFRIRGQVFHDPASAFKWAREQVAHNTKLKRPGRTIKVIKIETRTIFSEQI